MPYTLTTQAQVDYLRREFPGLFRGAFPARYIGYQYIGLPSEPYYTELCRLGDRPRYQNHYEPEILPLP